MHLLIFLAAPELSVKSTTPATLVGPINSHKVQEIVTSDKNDSDGLSACAISLLISLIFTVQPHSLTFFYSSLLMGVA